MAGVFITRTPTFFFLLSPSIESFVRRQLCKSPFYGYHEYPLAPSSLVSCCRTCTTCTLLEQQYSSRSLVQCAMMNRWTSTLRLTVESATPRPGFRSAAKLLSRERSESCLVCALRKVRTCLWISPFRVQFRRSALSDRRAQQRWRRRRSREGWNSWWGHFCEIMRQRKEKGLQSTTWKYLRRSKKKRHRSRFAPCTPHACTRTRLQHPRSLRATWLCNMCKYAERCGDRGPVTIPGHVPIPEGEQPALAEIVRAMAG